MKKLILCFLVAACRVVPQQVEPPEVINHTFIEPPRVILPEAGVRREKVVLQGFSAPGNPVTKGETPAENNVAIFLRYRADPPQPARAIIIAMPGFLGGGASFDALARALIKQSTSAGTPVELWAIDRRANTLEDTRGMDSAEFLQDAEIAHEYYYGTDTVGGVAFDGFRPNDDLDFMSEWGLETHIEDVRRIVSLIPKNTQKSRVFFMGHSLGASFVEAYAAWKFSDDTQGVDEFAGLILLDGVLNDTPISEDEFLNGVTGAFPSPGVNEIRAETRVSQLPILGQDVYTVSQVLALRALQDPEGIVEEDEPRDNLLRFALNLGALPHMTNRAALAFGFDDASSPLIISVSHLGQSEGGPLEEYQGVFGGTLSHPSDPNATYDWVDAFDTTPAELTPVNALAESMTLGGSNFYEWYFPARLSLDLAAVGGARIEQDSYQTNFGLRAVGGAEIDAPILAVAAGLLAPNDYEALRARVAPVVGAGRLQAGATRDQSLGFSIVDVSSTFGHLDPVTAPDSAQNPIPEAIIQFVLDNTETGSILIP